MKFWFVHTDETMVFSVDTVSGEIAAVLSNLGSTYEDVQRFGGLTLVEDQIWARCTLETPNDAFVFKRMTSDLTASAGTDVVDPTFVHDTTLDYWTARYNEGIYDPVASVVWTPWIIGESTSGAIWASFDATSGDLVGRLGNPVLAFNPFTYNDFSVGTNVCYLSSGALYTGFNEREGRVKVTTDTNTITATPTFINIGGYPRAGCAVVGECSVGTVTIHHYGATDTSDEYVRVWPESAFAYYSQEDEWLTTDPVYGNMEAGWDTYPAYLLTGGSGPATGEAWSATVEQFVGGVRVVGDEMYYTSVGNFADIGFTIWKINLLDGTITKVYDVPHFWVFDGGVVTTTEPTDFTGLIAEQDHATPHSMVVGASLVVPVLEGQILEGRRIIP